MQVKICRCIIWAMRSPDGGVSEEQVAFPPIYPEQRIGNQRHGIDMAEVANRTLLIGVSSITLIITTLLAGANSSPEIMNLVITQAIPTEVALTMGAGFVAAITADLPGS